MNADQHHLEQTLRDAVEAHGAALDTTVPDFGVLIAIRHRRSRRTLAAATATVALLGLGGVVLATNRTESSPGVLADIASVPVDDTTPGTEPALTTADITTAVSLPTPTVVSPPETVPAEYFCTDPIGEDQLGRQLFGSCEPVPGDLDGDYACTDRTGTENGFVIFSSCEPVGQLGAVPGEDEDAPFVNPDHIPVRSAPYVVQAGDYGIKIADEFCVTLDDLEAANGWSDAAREFPGRGNEVLIPVTADVYADGCGAGLYTIVESDTVRSRVAEMFCVSVQALDTANAETEGYSGFYPGLVIVIPPSSDDAC